MKWIILIVKYPFMELLAGSTGLHTMFTKLNDNCIFVN